MASRAAVVAALGAIAELGLPLSVTGVVPACEDVLSGNALRPTDVVTTAPPASQWRWQTPTPRGS